MTDLSQFNYPNFTEGTTNVLISAKVSQDNTVRTPVWTSLSGKSNKDMEIEALLNIPKFVMYVVKVRQDFIKNYSNYKKYPKEDESIWE